MSTATQFDTAVAAMRQLRLIAGLNPSLHTDVDGAHIVIEPGLGGIYHEQLLAITRVALDHGARLFLGPPDGKLALVWPSNHVPNRGEASPAVATVSE